MASLVVGIPLLCCSCRLGGDGSGTGGPPSGVRPEPALPGEAPVFERANLRGRIDVSPSGALREVLVDGQPATLVGDTWQHEVAVPPAGGEVLVELRVEGRTVAARQLTITQPE